MPRQFFVGGNFKMNGTAESITAIIKNLNEAKLDETTEVVVSPPALYLTLAQQVADEKKKVAVSSQNVFDKPNGAFTGEISVSQLQDAKIPWTIIGHSERRVILKETDEFIARKVKAAIDGGISVIFCIGETLEREADKTIEVVTKQLNAAAKELTKEQWSKVVIAYEPVWYVATTQQAQEVHAAIRKWLADAISPEASENTRIIYGGSVSEKNCRELAQERDVDGFLVGGASLKPACMSFSSPVLCMASC
ncbi:unnamed protein product [Aspergillus oryzae]|uniref:Triosephosphate isomerase n=2 Tax=Aspergillus oryzae TaxID=5062 RepID=A0AAN4YRK3_ASPOZ|nr:unnamed protein product [Aspergillus oryzae]GMF95653.1 unnamed protein product [Aspergillus oryzae]GMG11986.1 unnamed protein product [Aspergillus oryzae]GMG33512.1 unnamed protein product [Aspergillus oryzae]GMG50464.1 unnamed protein product [Aspergillus oryzae var. brunneus]